MEDLLNVSRWKRSVEDNSEVWSLDLGLRILGVKEVSCKRRLVRLNTSSIEHIKKKKKILICIKGVRPAFFAALLPNLASCSNASHHIQTQHKPVQVIAS